MPCAPRNFRHEGCLVPPKKCWMKQWMNILVTVYSLSYLVFTSPLQGIVGLVIACPLSSPHITPTRPHTALPSWGAGYPPPPPLVLRWSLSSPAQDMNEDDSKSTMVIQSFWKADSGICIWCGLDQEDFKGSLLGQGCPSWSLPRSQWASRVDWILTQHVWVGHKMLHV